MIIDKIIALNLERRENRRWAFLSAASVKRIPRKRIFFHKAEDHLDYSNDFSEILSAIQADGFGYLSCYGQGLETEYAKQTPASLCQIWNYCRLLRHISQGSFEMVFLTHDDRLPCVAWEIIETLAEELYNEAAPFFCFQLRIRGHNGELNLPMESIEDQFQHDKNIFSALIFDQPIEHYKDIFIQQGLFGYEESMLISPAGAQWILECLANNPGDYLFYDHFIRYKLAEIAYYMSLGNIGIYCPRRQAYKFIDEYLEFGSDTDWGTTENEAFISQSENKVSPQFLEL